MTANYFYLSRRSKLRRLPKTEILRIRTRKDPGISWKLYLVFILAWQCFVIFYPLIEPLSLIFGHVSFYYSYPNAHGFGLIFEPLRVQDLKMPLRAKEQLRLDWHRFNLNVGNVGRDGYRHPPSVERNLPHIDFSKRGIKHWPWRKRSGKKTDKATARSKV